MPKKQSKKKSIPFSKLQRRFVSEVELEDLTGVRRRTWQKYRLFDQGPPYYKIGGAVRYDLQETLDWIKAKRVEGARS